MKYWKQVINRYDENHEEIQIIYIIGDEDGPICEYLNKEEADEHYNDLIKEEN